MTVSRYLKVKFSRNRRADFFFGATFTSGLLACVATLMPFFARHGWFFDLFSHFRVQMLLCLWLAALILLCSQRKRFAILFFLMSLPHFLEIAPFYFPARRAIPPAENLLSVCLLNVNSSTGDPDKVLAYLKAQNTDVVVIQEFSSRWRKVSNDLQQEYPHQLLEVREDNFGMALLSRREFIHQEVLYFTGEMIPSLGVKVEMNAHKVYVFAAHPVPPIGAEYTDLRNRQLTEIGTVLANSSGSVILVGDLNTTPWSPIFKDLLRSTGLQNSMKGFGIQPTWPSFIPPLWIPLDHLLHSKDLAVQTRKIGPDIGSDHFPVEVSFVRRQPPEE